MKKILKRMFITLFIVLILVGLGIFWLSRSIKMGALPTEARLERMMKTPNFKDGVYDNLEHTPATKEGVSMPQMLYAFLFQKDKRNAPSSPLPVVQTDLKKLDINKDLLVWFGHSSYYIQLNGKRILVDPVFSQHASPVPFGVKAFEMTHTYTADQMPEIDILVITHDHWDHLDYPTFLAIKDRTKQIITSLGVGAHFERWGYPAEKIHELYWDESFQTDSLDFTAVPSRHFSGRWLKRNTSLWSGFVLQHGDYKMLLGGDSGYGKHFKRIGNQYGPFQLVILENGQYNENWKYIHMMPEEVFLAAADLQAQNILPVHSSKFPLALHAWDEPLIRVTKEAKRLNQPIWTPQIGQVVYLNSDNQFHEWWQNID